MSDHTAFDIPNSMTERTKEREDRIRERAFALWGETGQPTGREMDHWFAAEREIDEADRAAADTASLALQAEPDPELSGVRQEGFEERDVGSWKTPKTAAAPEPAKDTINTPSANPTLKGQRGRKNSSRSEEKPIKSVRGS